MGTKINITASCPDGDDLILTIWDKKLSKVKQETKLKNGESGEVEVTDRLQLTVREEVRPVVAVKGGK